MSLTLFLFHFYSVRQPNTEDFSAARIFSFNDMLVEKKNLIIKTWQEQGEVPSGTKKKRDRPQ